jgi:uncharacterized phage protein (TIGR01671 family)
MRQIKFRAWDDGVMYHTNDYANENNYGEYDHLYFFFQQIRGDAPLMQFTGLTDKNGKEIYEGDIVEDFFGRIMQVQWWNYRLCWVAITETNFHHADLFDWVDYDYEKEEKRSTARVEVIGNIYENPDLLK